jgi:ABC-type polysaccharide/polyol phosphate transport system ATPase subunit
MRPSGAGVGCQIRFIGMSQAELPPVVVDRVHKRFEIPREQVNTLKERVLHPLRRSPTDALQALRGVSFAVRPGEFFGIVGRNGSGKSTLLKCLAGIYRVDAGEIYVNGRMSTFIELGVGFNPDLPARDNAMLNATMLGLSPREARRRFDSVVDFAELREFVDLKIKNYSSGMLVRLAFSVMIHVDADVLLIDEVLAVGDAAFQQKCYEEFERIRRSGATVLFVTHDMSAVQRFCDRALLLEHGRPVELGEPERVGNRYLELNFSAQARQAEELAAQAEGGTGDGMANDRSDGANPADGATQSGPGRDAQLETELEVAHERRAAHERHPPASGLAAGESDAQASAETRYGDGSAEILEGWFEDEQGRRADVLQTGRPCAFVGVVRFKREVDDALFGINVRNSHRDHLLSASNLWSEPRCGTFHAGELVTFRIRFENVLSPDRYEVTPAVARHGGGWIDRREDLVSVMVTGARASDALVELPYEIAIERGPRSDAATELAL